MKLKWQEKGKRKTEIEMLDRIMERFIKLKMENSNPMLQEIGKDGEKENHHDPSMVLDAMTL